MRDTTGKTAIAYAAARGFDDIVRRLLDAGVDARERDGNDLTALMWAAGHEDGVGAGAASASSIFSSRVAHRSTPPTTAAARR